MDHVGCSPGAAARCEPAAEGAPGGKRAPVQRPDRSRHVQAAQGRLARIAPAADEQSIVRRPAGLLEARDRPGGRIYTRMEPSLAVPLELGAEFVHGRPKTGVAWPNERNALLIDAPQTRWILRNGRLQAADDLFDELRAALRRVGRPRKDLPLAQFLEGPAGGKLPKPLREFALTLTIAANSFRVADRMVATLKKG